MSEASAVGGRGQRTVRQLLVLLFVGVIIAVLGTSALFALGTAGVPRSVEELGPPLLYFALGASAALALGGAPYYLGRGTAPWFVLWTLCVPAILAVVGVGVGVMAAGALGSPDSTWSLSIAAAAIPTCVYADAAVPAAELVNARVDRRSSVHYG